MIKALIYYVVAFSLVALGLFIIYQCRRMHIYYTFGGAAVILLGSFFGFYGITAMFKSVMKSNKQREEERENEAALKRLKELQKNRSKK